MQEVRTLRVKQASFSDMDESSGGDPIRFLTYATVELGVSIVFGTQTI